MIARYRIVRGRRSVDDPLPPGVRQDTRKHTRHVLSPTPEMVERFLEAPNERGFARFERAYLELLSRRFEKQRAAFDALAALAGRKDVYLGCNCPTAKQPEVRRCHTWLALGFLRKHYPDLEVRFD